MRTSTKRILSIGVAAISFMATFVVYGSLIRPALDNISKQRVKVLSQETLFNNQKTAVEQVQKIIERFQSISKLQETVSLAIPLGENATQAMNQWQAIIRTAGVELHSFSLKPLAFIPSKQSLAKRLGALEAIATVEGSYDALKAFLRYLETNVRLVNVSNFSIVPVLGTREELYALTLTVEMYYQEKD